MIIDERMITYIHSLEGPENPVIEQIEQEALDTHVPIIRKETQSFLKVILMMKQPSRILEIGTAIGFSASICQRTHRLRRLKSMRSGFRLPGRTSGVPGEKGRSP